VSGPICMAKVTVDYPGRAGAGEGVSGAWRGGASGTGVEGGLGVP